MTKSKKQTRKLYQQLKDYIRPFDVVFFRGKTEPVSELICIIENIEDNSLEQSTLVPSHVGMIINTDVCNITNGKRNKLYILESTLSKITDGVPDVTTNESFFGVQIRDFEKVLLSYGGDVAIGRLIHNPVSYSKLKDIKAYFQPILETYIHLSYDWNCLSLFAAAFRPFRPIRNAFVNRNDRMFCSELLAHVYVDLDILPKDTITDEVLPVEFLTLGIIKDLIILKRL